MRELTVLTDDNKVSIKQLASAMLVGAAKRPQTTELLFRLNADGVICSCAFGAAWEGAHEKFDAQSWLTNRKARNSKIVDGYEIVQYFRLMGIFVIDPIDGDVDSIYAAVISLNDRHEWTREQIAAWLVELTGDELNFYFDMPIKYWPNNLRNTMNAVKPGSGDGIAETITAWLNAGKVELDSNLKPV